MDMAAALADYTRGPDSAWVLSSLLIVRLTELLCLVYTISACIVLPCVFPLSHPPQSVFESSFASAFSPCVLSMALSVASRLRVVSCQRAIGETKEKKLWFARV